MTSSGNVTDEIIKEYIQNKDLGRKIKINQITLILNKGIRKKLGIVILNENIDGFFYFV